MNKLAFKWSLILVIFFGSLALLYPSYEWYSKTNAEREKMEASGERPKRIINLGLDLRGGSSLLLELDIRTGLRKLPAVCISILRIIIILTMTLKNYKRLKSC